MREYTSYFKTWSKEMAYVLGFIAADGCVFYKNNKPSGLIINLHIKDECVIKNICQMLNYNGKLYYRKPTRGEKQVSLHITSVELAHDLTNLGLTRYKSRELQWPVNYPEEFMPDYIRGYFEGDGSINFHQGKNPNHTSARVSIVSTKEFIVGLKQYISKIYEKEIGHIHDHKTYAELSLTGAKSVLAFLDHIYENSTELTRMPRKYEKYLQFKNEFYPKFLENRIQLDKITYQMAESIRKDRIENNSTHQELSLKYNIHIDNIKNILNNTTHVNSDNRSGHNKSYFSAFGETKHLDDWVEDERCVVNEHTLYKRIYVQKMSPEEALTKKPDKTSGILKHIITAFGETKTLTEWANDPRCKTSRQTLARRINKMKMNPEEAMSTGESIKHNNVAENKFSNNQKVSLDHIVALRHLSQDKGYTVKQLADMFMLKESCVRDIVNYKTFKDVVVY